MIRSKDYVEVMRTRRSVRRYAPTPVPDDVIKEIMLEATYAPSAHNKQPWEFIVTRDTVKLEKLSHRRFAKFLKEAPCAIIVLSPWPMVERFRMFALQSNAAAIQNILLAARARGLGTCWIGDFDEELIRSTFNVPKDLRVVAVISLGYPLSEEDFKEPSSRKPVEEVTHWEAYGQHK